MPRNANARFALAPKKALFGILKIRQRQNVRSALLGLDFSVYLCDKVGHQRALLQLEPRFFRCVAPLTAGAPGEERRLVGDEPVAGCGLSCGNGTSPALGIDVTAGFAGVGFLVFQMVGKGSM